MSDKPTQHADDVAVRLATAVADLEDTAEWMAELIRNEGPTDANLNFRIALLDIRNALARMRGEADER